MLFLRSYNTHTHTLTCTEHIMFYHIMFQNSINLTWIEGHLGLKNPTSKTGRSDCTSIFG